MRFVKGERRVRIGDQMQCILLSLLKAERSPDSVIGKVMTKNAETWGKPGLSTSDLIKFLKGPLSYNAEGKFRYSVSRSFWRSLRTLLRHRLIYKALEKSPGRHGHLYRLTQNGLNKAEEVWAEVSMFIDEYSKLV